MKRMIEDEELRRKIAKTTTEKAIKEYDMAKNIDKWKDTYIEIIKRGVK